MGGLDEPQYVVLQGQGLVTYRVVLADGSPQTFESLDDAVDFAASHDIAAFEVVFPDGDVRTFRRTGG